MAYKPFYTPLKRSHLITPFGVGAVVLARNGISVMVCGLQTWLDTRPNHTNGRGHWLLETQLVDDHLTRRLGIKRLVSPPALEDHPSDNTWFIPVARFPRWEHCISPKCRRMVRRDAAEVSRGECTICEGEGRKRGNWPTQQVPLLLACATGHASDVPWPDWVHTDYPDDDPEDGTTRIPTVHPCSEPEALTYKVSTDVTAPVVECTTCNRSINLVEIRNRAHQCPGERPWIPASAAEPCNVAAQMLERTGTNLYYPLVTSALHITSGPTLDHRLVAFLERPSARAMLDAVPDGEQVSEQILGVLAAQAALHGIVATTASIADHLSAINDDIDVGDAELRTIELDVLLSDAPTTISHVGLPPLIVEARPTELYESGHFNGPAPTFSVVRAVPRVAETRVLTGFSRIEANVEMERSGFEQLWGAPADSAHERDWLLAHRVFGEGILLVLDPTAVDGWIVANQNNAQWTTNPPAPDWTARHWLAHTLSHALLREAATTCGYALPSLRERLYVDDTVTGPRTAILIYTAAGDAHGTLGGLVELADPGRLEKLIESAIEHTRWCGADPVCLEPIEGAGLITTPGACHHCLLVPETSCGHFNKGLDRATLIGGRPGTASMF